MFKIKKRHSLVLLITAAQTSLMFSGVVWFSVWLTSAIRTTVHDQVLADNVQTAKQMTNLIRQIDVTDLRTNPDSWSKIQSTIRDIRLPNDGFVCIVGAENGELLCHPALGDDMTNFPGLSMLQKSAMQKSAMQKPAMQKPAMQKPAMHKPAMHKPAMQKPAMQKPTMQKPTMQKPAGSRSVDSHDRIANNDANRIDGMVIEYDGELQIIAASFIPELNANVNVHQKAEGIENRIAAVVAPVRPVGFAISLVLIICTTVTVIAIMRQYDNRLASINEHLEELVDQRTETLRKTRDAVIFGLAKLAESRDTDTGEHLDRIRIYTTVLGNHIGRTNPQFDPTYVETLAVASSLHDIGKVGIPDAVLLKPGRFTADEREIMETHAVLGGRCLQAIGNKLGEDDFLQLSRQIAFFHHEKWDGSGYPLKLRGEAIPLSARIVALADVYDALRSRRPYKEPMPHERAKAIIVEGMGNHFDPSLVEAFIECEEAFIDVSERYNQNEMEQALHKSEEFVMA